MGRNSAKPAEARTALAPGREAPAAPHSKAHTIGRLLREGRAEASALAAGSLAMLLGTATALATPALFGRVIDTLQAQALATQAARGADAAAAAAAQETARAALAADTVALVAVALASSVLSAAQSYLFGGAGERVVASLRRRVFRALLEQEVSFFDQSRTQELVSRLGGDTAQLRDAATVQVVAGVRQVLLAVGGLVYLLTVSARLTLLLATLVPVLAVSARLFGRWTREQGKRVREALAEATQAAEEAISGIRTVRSFSMEGRVDQTFSDKVEDVLRLGLRAALFWAAFAGLAEAVMGVAFIGILYYGGTVVLSNEITAGTLTSFLLYAMRIGGAMSGLASTFTSLSAAVGATERVYELLDREPLVPLDEGFVSDTLKGDIEFRNVHFAFPARANAPVLRGLSLKIESGTVVALVGPSGAGKSTCMQLIERFYDPQQGSILVDGRELAKLSGASLRRHVGCVLQEPVLFADTIRNNIAFAAPAATTADVERAARAANAHDFIMALPETYATVVGERGVRLSGGQRQRIAIARAVLQDPKLLLLDEASSALDAESEHLVKAALERLMLGRTTVLVAHRLSTVRAAAKIFVIDAGVVAAEGTHDELLAASPLYARLVRRQLGCGGGAVEEEAEAEAGSGAGVDVAIAVGGEADVEGEGEGEGDGLLRLK
jgi:ABC-type multidrug transport system fused ATPase/permease subunit